ncbi:MAG: NAD(P)-binding domain-containing protein, partial [Thermoanaerobaculia bacterium]
LQKAGLDAVCYDRGGILDSIYHFPEEMVWFSTRDLLDIAGVPFTTPQAHPTRLESLAYYRGVAEKFRVPVVAETEIERIERGRGGFLVHARRRGESVSFPASAAVLATGFFHNPKKLDVPGCDQPHVHSRYISAFPYHGRNVVVVGSRNGAAEAALDLYRHGARVTLVARAGGISERVKYWVKPDLENRIRDGAIRAFFHTRVVEIGPRTVSIAGPARGQGSETPRESPDPSPVPPPAGEGGRRPGEVGPRLEEHLPAGRPMPTTTLPADAVFALIGYEPDFALLERCGIRLEGEKKFPIHDAETLESNVPGIYLAGALLTGTETGRIFIENSRHHASQIARSIAGRVPSVHA